MLRLKLNHVSKRGPRKNVLKLKQRMSSAMFGISSTLNCDFWPLTVISDDLRVMSDVFVKLSQVKKSIVEEIELIMGACVEQSSPSWVCIPQKSLAIARDSWNTNSLGWIPFHMGAHDHDDWFIIACIWLQQAGPRLNIKTVLSTYGDFHVRDKTAVRTSYL